MLDLTLPFEIAAILFLILVLGLVGFTVRRYLLTRTHGSFDCALRDGGGWTVGIARYGPDRVNWYRVFGLGMSPSRTFRRNGLEIVGRRELDDSERHAVLPDSVVCLCRYEGHPFELALSMDAYMGLSSWSEAAPPGQQWWTPN